MPIIAQVGRRKLSIRILIAAIYVVLGFGALSIVYPFALMLSSSVSTRIDYDRFDLVPLAFRGTDARFVGFLADRYSRSDWAAFRAAYPDSRLTFWDDLAADPEGFVGRAGLGRMDRERLVKYREFLMTLDPSSFGAHHLLRVGRDYEATVVERLKDAIPRSERLRELMLYLPANNSLFQVHWSPPDTGAYRRIREFRRTLPPEDRLLVTGRALWIGWLESQWSLDRLNKKLGTSYPSLNEVPFLQPNLREAFFEQGVPSHWQGRVPEMAFARFLESSNEWEELPVAEFDYAIFREQAGVAWWHLLTGNYRQVVDYLFTKGTAAWNTVVLVVLSVFTALTINPLAAYALARFRLAFTPSVILFCLATSAFPSEVAMIPSFLLLRDLGLLNTFGALVLPTAANGFSIFLLKGFFESLPKELYEAAEIDGAGELRKFFQITMPLSAPILAVTALGAFTAAYTGFMWAFLVCQRQEIWTVMVWLFQFQQEQTTLGNPSIGMASLVVASIPTLLVFLFCQKIIMRGIVVPSMK